MEEGGILIIKVNHRNYEAFGLMRIILTELDSEYNLLNKHSTREDFKDLFDVFSHKLLSVHDSGIYSIVDNLEFIRKSLEAPELFTNILNFCKISWIGVELLDFKITEDLILLQQEFKEIQIESLIL